MTDLAPTSTLSTPEPSAPAASVYAGGVAAEVGVPAVAAPVAEPEAAAPEAEADDAADAAAPTPETPPETPTPLEAKDYTLTTPEGFVVNEEAMGQFTKWAAENAIPLEQAQTLFDLYAGQAANQTAAAEALWDSTQKEWATAWAADPIIGGSNRAAVDVTIAKALDEYGDQATRDAFTLTGAGNNPHIAKLIFSMAKALTEGTSVPALRPAPRAQAPADKLYSQ